MDISYTSISYVQACLVHTTETIRVRYFMDRLLEHRRPVMLVGNAGTGKSVLVGDKLGSLDAEKYMIKNVPFNYYTTSAMLQGRNIALVWDNFNFLKEECNIENNEYLIIYRYWNTYHCLCIFSLLQQLKRLHIDSWLSELIDKYLFKDTFFITHPVSYTSILLLYSGAGKAPGEESRA